MSKGSFFATNLQGSTRKRSRALLFIKPPFSEQRACMAASESEKPRPVSRKTRRKGIDRLQSLPLELLLLVSSAASMWCRISCDDAAFELPVESGSTLGTA